MGRIFSLISCVILSGSPSTSGGRTALDSRGRVDASSAVSLVSRKSWDRRQEDEGLAVSGASKRIQSELEGWEGITSAPHRFGGVEFKLGSREIGHVHGDSLVDVPLPKPVRDELVSSAEAEPHHVLPRSGWVSIHVNEPSDIDRALRALRRSYEIALQQRERRLGRRAPTHP